MLSPWLGLQLMIQHFQHPTTVKTNSGHAVIALSCNEIACDFTCTLTLFLRGGVL
jgi:hypothetical protein